MFRLVFQRIASHVPWGVLLGAASVVTALGLAVNGGSTWLASALAAAGFLGAVASARAGARPWEPEARFEDGAELQHAVQRLYREKKLLADQVDELSAVREVSLAVGAILDFSEMIRAILDLITTHYGITKALIYLQSQDEDWFEVVGARAGGQDISPSRVLQKRVRRGAGLVGRAAEERREVIECREEKGVIAAVPLVAKNRVVGVLKLFDTDVTTITPERCKRLHAVAGAIAMALENSRLYRLAVTDGLTGLYVHRHFQLRLEEEFQRSRRYDAPLSLLLIDIDHFKKFNDTHGHVTGDAVLRGVAGLIREESRGTDVACRYGGEEMTVILPETDLEGAGIIAERIRARIAAHAFRCDEAGVHDLKVSVSVGVSSLVHGMTRRGDLVETADAALYRAKQNGRNRVERAESVRAETGVA